MGGIGSGRKRESKSRDNAQRSLTASLPIAVDVIIETAKGLIQDRLRYEAATEIKNSVMGKPKATTDLNVLRDIDISAATIRQIYEVQRKALREYNETLLLTGGENAVQGQGEAEGSSQESG